MNKPTYGPKCPNHGCYLKDIPFPMPSKGVGVCPASGAKFDYVIEVDEDIVTTDKFGNKSKQPKWSVSGDEK